MRIKLINNKFEKYGIFGQLLDESGKQIAVTLQHSYFNKPKIPDGFYSCHRGQHKLDGMSHSFETFEVTGIKGHFGLLFHTGNSNADSDGCILLGKYVVGEMIMNSRMAFEEFMELMKGRESFGLEVVSLTPFNSPA